MCDETIGIDCKAVGETIYAEHLIVTKSVNCCAQTLVCTVLVLIKQKSAVAKTVIQSSEKTKTKWHFAVQTGGGRVIGKQVVFVTNVQIIRGKRQSRNWKNNSYDNGDYDEDNNSSQLGRKRKRKQAFVSAGSVPSAVGFCIRENCPHFAH